MKHLCLLSIDFWYALNFYTEKLGAQFNHLLGVEVQNYPLRSVENLPSP